MSGPGGDDLGGPCLAVPAEREVSWRARRAPGSWPTPVVGWALVRTCRGSQCKEESTVLSAAGHPQAQKERGRKRKSGREKDVIVLARGAGVIVNLWEHCHRTGPCTKRAL